jgi:hypothetical protein
LLKIAGDHNKIEEVSHAPVGRNVKLARVCIDRLFGWSVGSFVSWLLLRDVARCADACLYITLLSTVLFCDIPHSISTLHTKCAEVQTVRASAGKILASVTITGLPLDPEQANVNRLHKSLSKPTLPKPFISLCLVGV